MERLILARHGESSYSERGLVNGDPSVPVGLTARGEEESRALGRVLADDPIDLCVVTAFARTRGTAEIALSGREVPVMEVPELGDPRAGLYEGRHLDEYRAWAWTSGSDEEAPGGGESRLALVERYLRAYRLLLGRLEPLIVAVVHALPIAYVLRARDGWPPAPRVDMKVEHALPYPLAAGELQDALVVLETWLREPTW
jgi:probable phosphoglycerate mutase